MDQGAIADFGAAQGLLVAFVLDGGGQLPRDQSEDFLIAIAEARVFGIALEDERAEDVMVHFERDAQPVKGRRAGEFDLAALLHLFGEFGSTEQGLARA